MKHTAKELVKFKKLQRRLGFSKQREVIGLLESLWHLAQRECPRGDIGRLDDESIAIELEWDGEPEKLVDALVETGWLDRCAQHRLVIHDWAEHAPRFVHGVAQKKGGIIRAAVPVEDCNEGLQSTTIVGVETLDSEPLACAGTTIPNLTIPNHSYTHAVEARKSKHLQDAAFAAVWRAWSRHLSEQFKMLTPTAEEAQLYELAAYSTEEATAIVRFSIGRQAKNLILTGDHKGKPPPSKPAGGFTRKTPGMEKII